MILVECNQFSDKLTKFIKLFILQSQYSKLLLLNIKAFIFIENLLTYNGKYLT